MHYFTLKKFAGYEYVGFQKMRVMHKGYAYQFSDLIALRKIATKNQEPRLLEPTKTCGGIEPEKLCPIAAQVP
jgi:hypothetical protein